MKTRTLVGTGLLTVMAAVGGWMLLHPTAAPRSESVTAEPEQASPPALPPIEAHPSVSAVQKPAPTVTAGAPAQVSGAPVAPTGASGDSDLVDLDLEAKLAALNQLRKIPGAAPLVDELVQYFKDEENDDDEPTAPGASGQDAEAQELEERKAEQDDAREEHMQAIWEKLLTIMAQHPEVTGAKSD